MNWTKGMLAAAAVGALLTATLVRADEKKEDEAAEHANARKGLAKATITLADAVKMALAKVPGSRAVEAELEVEGDEIVFEVEVIAGDKHKEVEIDAVSGKVKEVEDEDDDDDKDEEKTEQAAAGAKLTLSQAIEIASQRVPGGKAFEAEPEMEKGKLIFEVELIAGDKVMEVEIDAMTGEVLEVEEE